ncbi:hypothetical protein SADUNF_Sadunf04G0005000 [Salix dunnii]|uniref:Uncharacterized protein n=1 Tax=Salix dunnii TaxID=1413687 RepID=A0A835KCC9_9ROSI|nr:hypothetical protein SADUNF_Sadunf04G0005000 [Salix dunnii]
MTISKKVVVGQLTTSPWNNLVFKIYYGMIVDGESHVHKVLYDTKTYCGEVRSPNPRKRICSKNKGINIRIVLASRWVGKSPVRATVVSCSFPRLFRSRLVFTSSPSHPSL